MNGFLVVAEFIVVPPLSSASRMVLAIGLPCLAYVFIKDLPIELVGQPMVYALTASRWSPCRYFSSSAA